MDTEYNSLDQFIKGNFPKLYPKKNGNGRRTLYHYTLKKTLNILLKPDADLLLTKCSCLNDDAEFKLGIEVVMNYLKRKPEMNRGIVRGLLDDFLQYDESLPRTFSLTRESDSLYQWIAYTDKHLGGINIGFDFEKLQKLVQTNNRANANNIESLMFLAPCFYVRKLRSRNLDKLMDFVFGKYRDGLKTSLDQRYITIYLIFIVASLVKGFPFRYENEWRIVCIPSRDDIVKRAKEIAGKSRLFSGIFNAKNKLIDIWSSVTISPHGSVDERVCSILKRKAVKSKFLKSKITYNGR